MESVNRMYKLLFRALAVCALMAMASAANAGSDDAAVKKILLRSGVHVQDLAFLANRLSSLAMENGAYFHNETDNVLTFVENSEDLLITFSANQVTLSSSTGVSVFDLGALVLELENGAQLDNGTNNTVALTENSEDITWTFAANLITMASTTGATFALTPAVAITGDLTLSGGAGALTFSDSASSVLLPDNDATALLLGSTDTLNLLTFDTTNSAEGMAVGGYLTATTPAMHLAEIRFCGNGPNGATSNFISPVPHPMDTANYEFGGTGCDAEDSETEATADEVYSGLTMLPVAIACVISCTGASTVDDAVTFQLRANTADVTGVTCNATMVADDTPAQCTATFTSPQTIAAELPIAIEMAATDDVCNDVGDDVECYVYVTH